MKRMIKLFGILCVMLALVFTGCGESANHSPQTEKTISVYANNSSVRIRDDEVEGYDYTELFTITVDGANEEVLASYIDASQVSQTPGIYQVTCTYEGKSAFVTVEVLKTDYRLSLAQEEVTVKLSEAATYDLKALFTARIGTQKTEIAESMITTDYKAEVGDYTYTVDFHGIQKTLTVHVVPDHTVEAVLSYSVYRLHIDKAETFDVTELFSLYVDGGAVKVTEDMIDATALEGDLRVGQKYSVSLHYEVAAGYSVDKTATVEVVGASELTINARNIETYPNSGVIDLTTLFTITEDGENIPVTMDMIEGSVDYSKAGENVITLTYGEQTETATVTVRLGIIIEYATASVVNVRLGTKQETYPFADDFLVYVNGVRYRNIPDSCFVFGTEEKPLDFAQEGEYEVTLHLTYGDKPTDPTAYPPVYPEPTVVEKKITYHVSAISYRLSVKEETVHLPEGTTAYDYSGNIELYINSTGNEFRQGLTDREDYADAITTYYETVKGIDFTSGEMQEVRLKLYVFGADAEPVEVSFHVIIAADIVIEPTGKAVFEGSALYTRDLFRVTENGEEIEVTEKMVSGKVDTFKPGVYTVRIDYKGFSEQANVIVYPKDMVGRYGTLLTTVPVAEEDDDSDIEGGAEWYENGYGAGEYSLTAAALPQGVSYLGDLVISEDGSITFNGMTAYSVTGIDEHTMFLTTGSNGSGREYTLHYDNGIVMLEVDNTIRLGFSDYARPIVYFDYDMWQIDRLVTVNYSDSHVLQRDTTGSYSLDCTHLTAKEGGAELWYGLYVRLVVRTSGDTVYDVRWGEATFSEGFEGKTDETANVQLGDLSFDFTMTSDSVGKVIRNEGTNPYAGITFNGTLDGKAAQLAVNASGGYTFTVSEGSGSKELFKYTSYEIGNMKYGGVLSDGTLLLYMLEDSDYGTFSYKFELDTDKRTFTILPKDLYCGLYRAANGEDYIYLDGYGGGVFRADGSSVVLTYKVKGNELTAFFDNYDPKYAYGQEATFYIADLLNVLTGKSSKNDVLSGVKFVNEIITDGATVDVRVNSITSSEGTDALLAGITIVTKDGVLSGDAKVNAVDLNCVNSNASGYYEFSVTVSVNGENKVSRYGVQVFASTYAGNALLGSYGRGVLSGTNFFFSLDEYGRASVNADGTSYTGSFAVDGKHFYIKAYSAAGTYLSAEGEELAPGVVILSCSGAVRRTDYFCRGESRVAGTAGTVVRRLAASDGSYVYILAGSATASGEVLKSVEEPTQGNRYTLTKQDGTVIYAEIVWGNDPSFGLTIVEDEG